MTTKTRITAALLATMPDAMANQVREWKSRYRKAFVRLEKADRIYFEEDGKYTAYNVRGDVKYARACGEWAGFTNLMCNTSLSLPVGTAVVEEVIFLGEPMLKIYTGTAMPEVPAAKVEKRLEIQDAPYGPFNANCVND